MHGLYQTGVGLIQAVILLKRLCNITTIHIAINTFCKLPE